MGAGGLIHISIRQTLYVFTSYVQNKSMYFVVTSVDEGDGEMPYKPTTESRFMVRPVELLDVRPDTEDMVEEDDSHSLVFRPRLDTNASEITQSDLSRMGILSSFGDAGKAIISLYEFTTFDL